MDMTHPDCSAWVILCIGHEICGSLAGTLGEGPGLSSLFSHVNFRVSVRVAELPRLLLTVMFCGLVGQVRSPR
jgi:hypothetical protein